MRNIVEEAAALERLLSSVGCPPNETLPDQVAHLIRTFAPPEIVEKWNAALVPPAPVAAPEPVRVLSEDQAAAWQKLVAWTTSNEPHFVLSGFAGTGKTYLMQMLANLRVGVEYSATTNKAAKVLGKSIGKMAKTTHSLLGLRMEQQEDKLVLTPARNPPYLPRNTIVVVDESSMVGTQLFEAIEAARRRLGIRILFVGDPAQLPPVGEHISPVWKCTNHAACTAMLRKVMRNDNELLALATTIRARMRRQKYVTPLESNHSDKEGVWKWKSRDQFEAHMLRRIPLEKPSTANLRESKVIAWRNTTVDRYNAMIRTRLGFFEPFCTGDIVLLAEPVERNKVLIAHTDDEFLVEKVLEDSIHVNEYDDVSTWQLHVVGDQKMVLQVPKDIGTLDSILGSMAKRAREAKSMYRKQYWDKFWEAKNRFNRVRYGYALTAHRAQGSTYTECYVDQADILANPNKREAFRCLYVACTRASKTIHSY